MKLVDEIIELAVDHQKPLADILRKCVVLGYQLKNENLKIWVEKELDGYGDHERVPDYRKIRAGAKGLLIGPFGSQIRNQPIPPSILDQRHSHFATIVELMEPVASYEMIVAGSSSKRGTIVLEWPPDLTLTYQKKIMQGYALNRAWQEISPSSLVGVIDTVRNRLLKFALEIKDQLGMVRENIDALQPAKIDQLVINNIYGGQNIISGTTRDITQIGDVIVERGDFAALERALSKAGLDQEEISKLQEALHADLKAKGGQFSPIIGNQVGNWLKDMATKLATTGVDISSAVAKAELTKLISQYLGLS